MFVYGTSIIWDSCCVLAESPIHLRVSAGLKSTSDISVVRLLGFSQSIIENNRSGSFD